jgi:hypothetical protein
VGHEFVSQGQKVETEDDGLGPATAGAL